MRAARLFLISNVVVAVLYLAAALQMGARDPFVTTVFAALLLPAPVSAALAFRASPSIGAKRGAVGLNVIAVVVWGGLLVASFVRSSAQAPAASFVLIVGAVVLLSALNVAVLLRA